MFNLKPKQTPWDKVVDIFSANTPMDQYKRRKEDEERAISMRIGAGGLKDPSTAVRQNRAYGGAPTVFATNKSEVTNGSSVMDRVKESFRDVKAGITGSDFRDRDRARTVQQQQSDNLINTAKQMLVTGTPEQKIAARKILQDKSWAVDTSYKPEIERNPVGDAVNQQRYGAYRSLVGTVQGAAGAYDLLTPGKGTNRLSKSSTSLAENIDQTAENMGIDGAGYHAGQFYADVLTFMTGSQAFKGLSMASKAKFLQKFGGNQKLMNTLNTANKPLSWTSNKIDNTLDVIGANRGRFGYATTQALKEGKQPWNLAETAVDTMIGTGQIAAQGEQVTPADLLLQASISGGFNVGLPFMGYAVKGKPAKDAAEGVVDVIADNMSTRKSRFNPLKDKVFAEHYGNYKNLSAAWYKESIPANKRQLERAIKDEFNALNQRGAEIMNSKKTTTLGSGPFGEGERIIGDVKRAGVANDMLDAEKSFNDLQENALTPINDRINELERRANTAPSDGMRSIYEKEIANLKAEYDSLLDEWRIRNIFDTPTKTSNTTKPKSAIPDKPKQEYSQALLDELGMSRTDVETLGIDPYDVLNKKLDDAQKAVDVETKTRQDNFISIVEDLTKEGYTEDQILKVLGDTDIRDIGDAFTFKNKVRQAAIENPATTSNPSFGGVTLKDIQARKGKVGGEKPRVTAKEADTPKEAIFNRLMELGLSHKTAVKLLDENNTLLENTIFKSGDYIKKANNPDAYASKIIDDARARGQAAYNQQRPIVGEKTGTVESNIGTPKGDTNAIEVDTTPVEKTKPRVTAKDPETEVRKASDILSRTMSEQEYSRVVDEVRAKDGLDYKLNYMRRILQNNLKKNKKAVTDSGMFELNTSKDGFDQIIKKDTGEVVAEFSPNNTYDEMLGYAEAARIARDGERGIPTEPIQTVSRSENVMEQGPEPKTSQNAPEQPTKPFVSDKKEKLGNIVKDFYKNTKEYTYDDLKQLGDRVTSAIKREFKDAGMDFEAVARKVDEANWNKVNSLSEAGLTVKEAGMYRKVLDELDSARVHANEAGKKKLGKGNQGETYFPRQKAGTYNDEDALLAGFKSDTPGNEISRRGDEFAITPDQAEHTPEVVGQYVTRYGDENVVNKGKIKENLKKNNPSVADNKLEQAAGIVNDIQQRANDAVRSLFGGVGKQRIRSGGEKLNLVDDFGRVGSLLGYTKTKVNGRVKGLRLDNKLKSVTVDNEPIFTKLGIEQHRNAINFSSRHVADGNYKKSAINYLKENYNLTDERLSRYTRAVENIDDELPDEIKQAKLFSLYKEAAKEQYIDGLQRIEFADAKTADMVNSIGVEMVREGTIRNAFSQQFATKKNTTTNAIFRKLSLSTAINELSDISGIYAGFGKDMTVKANPKILKEFGVHSGAVDPAVEAIIKQINKGASAKGGNVNKALTSAWSAAKKANNLTNFYRAVEWYKTANILQTSKEFHTSKGLSGDDLTNAVLKDYRELVLPRDAYNKTFLDNYPFWTQYMSWAAMNMQKEGKLLTGSLDVGKFSDMSKKQRVARNLAMNTPAKTLFWLSSNALKGTAIMTAFGLTDFTGLTNKDYSGIQEEDKSFYDKTTQFTNISTTMSIINNVYQSVERQNLKDKYKDADYNPYENTATTGESLEDLATPQFVKNIWGSNVSPGGAEQLRNEGYKENKAGKVQYESPDNALDWIKAYAFGPGQTSKGREYSGRQDVITRAKNNGGNPLQAMSDMAREDLNLKENNYTRPLTPTYSDEYKKQVDKEARTAMLEGGRQYNKYLDDLRKNDPDAYNDYIGTMDNNHVSPEYWNDISNGGKDLTNFKMIRDRKKQLKKDIGTNYPPMYDLSDEQARAVLQLKSVATGDDIALENSLYKQQWYKDYKDADRAYYAANPYKEDGTSKPSDRVKQWNDYNAQYGDLKRSDEGAAWKKDYPLVYDFKQVVDKYGYDSDERKAWQKKNYDAWEAEKERYDKAKLDLINKMRAIEGEDPMSYEQFQQVSNVKNTDKDSSNGYSYGSGFTGSPGPSLAEFTLNLSGGTIVKDGRISAPRKAGKPKVASRKIAKPKVTIKKSKA